MPTGPLPPVDNFRMANDPEANAYADYISGNSADFMSAGTRSLDLQGPGKAQSGNDYNFAEHAMYFTALTTADFFANTAASFGLVDDDFLEQTVKENFPGASDYLNQYEGAIGIASTVGGALIPGMAAVKAVQSASRIGSILKNVPGMKHFLVDNARQAKLAHKLYRAESQIAKAGIRGPEALMDTVRTSAYKEMQMFNVGRGLKESFAAELAIFASQNANENMFPEEWTFTDYLPWMAGGAAADIALGGIMLRKTARVLAQRAQSKYGQLADNPHEIPRDFLTSGRGNNDLAATWRQVDIQQLKMLEDEAKAGNVSADIKRLIPQRISMLNKTQQQLRGEINLDIDAIGSEVIPGVIGRYKPTADVYDNIHRGLEKDAFHLLGVKSIDVKPALDDDLKAIPEKLKDHVKGLRQQANIAVRDGNGDEANRLFNLAAEREQLQTFVYRNNSYLPVEENYTHFADAVNAKQAIKYVFDKTNGMGQSFIKDHKGADGKTLRSIAVSDDFNIDIMSGSRSAKAETAFAGLTTEEKTAVFALYDNVITRRANPQNSKARVAINKDAPWMKKDAVMAAVERGALKETDIAFEPGYTFEKMQIDTINSKYQLWTKQREVNENAMQGFIKTKAMNDTELRVGLNLPADDFKEISPLETYFWSLRGQGKKDIDISSVTDLKSKLESHTRKIEGMDILTRGINLSGKQFDTIFEQPLVVMRKDLSPMVLTRQTMQEQLTMVRQDTLTKLQSKPNFVGSLAKAIFSNPAFKTATRPDTLTEGMSMGQGIVTTSRFSTRDAPAIQAAHDIETVAQKMTRSETEEMFNMAVPFYRNTPNGMANETAPALKIITALRTSEKQGALAELGAAMQAKHRGWALKATPQFNENTGRWTVMLDEENMHNKRTFKTIYGRDLGRNTPMPRFTNDGVYAPMELSQDALDGWQALSALSARQLDNQNTVFESMGMSPISSTPWHIPPKDFSSKHIAYIMNPAEEGGNSIKHMVAGKTASDLKRQLDSEEIAEFLQNNPGTIIRRDDEVKSFFTARNKHFFAPVNVGDVIYSRGKAAKGSSQEPVTTSARVLLDDAISSLIDQTNRISRDTVSLMYEPQLNYARRMHAVHGNDRNSKFDIFQKYQNAVHGGQVIERNDTLGAAYRAVETVYDDVLNKIWDATNQRGIKGQLEIKGKQAIAKMTFGKIDPLQKEVDRLKADLGQYAPFETVQEFLASNFNVRPPKTMVDNMATLNKITANLALRWADVSHAILNMSGVISTAPAVIASLQRSAGESLQAYQSRTAAWNVTFPSKKGMDYSFFDSTKAMVSAAHFAKTPEGLKVLSEASKRGFIRQEVAEIHRTLNDPLATGGNWDKFAKKVDTGLGYLADKSEDWARGWSHLMAYRLMKAQGVTDENTLHTFAHRFSNEVIGDYRSGNRPQVFQGAVGMPLGLFQTYMWNYYQRLFSYIENRNTRAIGTQLAMQASIFGGVTLPGYAAFSALWEGAYDGKDTPASMLQANYGKNTADMLMYGTISNLPKLFASDGIAFYTRGDVSPRVGALAGDLTQTAVGGLYSSVVGTVGGILDQVLSGGRGLDARQTTETVAAFSISRPLRSLIELASGHSLDTRGNVLSNEVHSGIGIAARMLSSRTLGESKAREVEYAIRATDASQAAKRARTREALKSAIRGDNVNEEVLLGTMKDYLMQGGAPSSIPSFLNQAAAQAVTPRAQLKLQQLMNSEKFDAVSDIMKFYGAGVSLPEGTTPSR